MLRALECEEPAPRLQPAQQQRKGTKLTGRKACSGAPP